MDSASMTEIPGHFPSVPRPVADSPPDPAQALPAVYAGLRAFARPLLSRLFDLRVTGLGHVPVRGPFVVAANHANYLDGVVLGAVLSRKIAFLVMPRVYHASPLHPALHRHIGSIRIDPSRPDPAAVRRALRVLATGGVLGIFPEGPHGWAGHLAPGQAGVAVIALRSGVPVVPAGITGTFEALAGRRWHIPRRVPLRLRFGRPLCFAWPARRALARAVRSEVTRRIMTEIAALLVENRCAPAATGVSIARGGWR